MGQHDSRPSGLLFVLVAVPIFGITLGVIITHWRSNKVVNTLYHNRVTSGKVNSDKWWHLNNRSPERGNQYFNESYG